jgi:hypothetical protein
MSQVKIRYDGKGSEFGDMHRKLPSYCGMFDIDRMSAVATIHLELKNQDVGFIEYRTNFEDNSIKFVAMFEVKYKDSEHVQKAMQVKTGTSVFAQVKMAETLNCRYFMVIATEGKNPFTFYEHLKDEGFKEIGILDYDNNNKEFMVRRFWNEINLL